MAERMRGALVAEERRDKIVPQVFAIAGDRMSQRGVLDESASALSADVEGETVDPELKACFRGHVH